MKKEDIVSITPTRLSTYLMCPRLYKARFIDKSGDTGRSPQLAFGTTIHSALEHLYKPTCSASVKDVLRGVWNRSDYFGAEESEEYFEKGRVALEKYAKEYLSPRPAKERILSTEEFMSFTVRQGEIRVRLSARADRIDGDGGVIEVIDYKVSSRGVVPTEESLHSDLPTFLVWLLARRKYGQDKRVRVTYLNVLTLAKVSVEYTGEEIDKNKRQLWNVIKDIVRSDFRPTSCSACAYCPIRSECSVGGVVIDFDYF